MQVNDFRQRILHETGRLAVKLDLAGFLHYVLEYSPDLRMWTSKELMASLFEASCQLNKPAVLATVVKVAEKHELNIYRDRDCPLHCALELS